MSIKKTDCPCRWADSSSPIGSMKQNIFTNRYCLTIQSLYGARAQWFVTTLERVWGDQDFVMLFPLVIYSVKGQCWRRCGVRQYLLCIYVLICFWGFRFLLFSFSLSLSLSLFHPSSAWSVRTKIGCSWVPNWEVRVMSGETALPSTHMM